MVVVVVVKNQTANRELTYVPCQPTLTDDIDNTYASKQDGPLPQPDALMPGRTLHPGELVAVRYCFERPKPSAKLFTLTFPQPTNISVAFSRDKLVAPSRSSSRDTVVPPAGFSSWSNAGPPSGSFSWGSDVQPSGSLGKEENNDWTIIDLPSDEITRTTVDVPSNWVNLFYPTDASPWVDYYPDGRVRLVVSVQNKKLHGVSTSLYRDGSISMLANYDQGALSGPYPVRLWDGNKNMVLYSEFVNGKRSGRTIYFVGRKPALVQIWNCGRRLTEYTRVGTTRDGTATMAKAKAGRLLDGFHREVKDLMARVIRSDDTLHETVRTAFATSGATAQEGQSTPHAPSARLQFRSVLSSAYRVPVIDAQ